MAHSLKTIKSRLRSIENTRKVTSAMEMISVSKLNRTEKMLYSLKPYVARLEEMFSSLSCGVEADSGPFFRKPDSKGAVCLCVVASDSGLCASYNNNIINFTYKFITGYGREKVKLLIVGRKAHNYFRQMGVPVFKAYTGLNGKYSDKVCVDISDTLTRMFLSGEASEVRLAYTAFETALLFSPVMESLLPVERRGECRREYLLEPDKGSIVERLIPSYIRAKVKLMLVDSFTAEHAARAVAMKTATENARDILQHLVLLRNKVRQANITQEIMEVISSSEALRG